MWTMFYLWNRYVEWICRAEDLVLAEERTTEADRVKIMEARQKAAEKMKKMSLIKHESVETNSMEDGGGDDKGGKKKGTVGFSQELFISGIAEKVIVATVRMTLCS